ncbi:MAG: hypothetical protein AB1765_07165, partial [Candidatus Hydrogenedentota bacterium]
MIDIIDIIKVNKTKILWLSLISIFTSIYPLNAALKIPGDTDNYSVLNPFMAQAPCTAVFKLSNYYDSGPLSDTDSADFSEDSPNIIFCDTFANPYSPISSAYIGDTLYIVLSDRDENNSFMFNGIDTSSDFQDTVYVTITSTIGNDTIIKLILEEAINTAVFRDSIILSSQLSNDTYLLVGDGDTVILRYESDIKPSLEFDTYLLTVINCPQTFGVLRFTRSNNQSTDTYNIADFIYLTLTDLDRNNNPKIKDTVVITITSAIAKDTAIITLVETTETSAFFTNAPDTGVISTDSTSTTSTDTIILVANGDTITAYFNDTENGDTPTDTAIMYQLRTNSNVEFIRSDWSLADTYLLGSEIVYVVVTDADRNNNPIVVESVVVTVYSTYTSDSVIIVLNETSDRGGVFVGSMDITDSKPVVYGDTELLVSDGDTITVWDTDNRAPIDSDIDTAVIKRKQTYVDVEFINELNIRVDTYLIGTKAYVIVTDYDQNINPIETQVITVTLYSQITGDTAILVLTETTDRSGIFSGGVGVILSDTLYLIGGDSVLLVGDGDTISVWDTDYYHNDSEYDTAIMIQPLTPSQILMVNLNEIDTDIIYISYDKVFIILTDLNRNNNPILQELIQITIYSRDSKDTEIIYLTETGERTGIFKNLPSVPGGNGLRTSDTTGLLLNDNILALNDDDSLTAKYVDIEDTLDLSFDTSSAEQVSTLSKVLIMDSYGFDAVIVFIGDSIYIIVTDIDQNNNVRTPDTIQITIISDIGEDTVIVTLTETSDTSGVFGDSNVWNNGFAIITSDSLGSSLNDLILLLGDNDTITLEYEDDEPEQWIDTALDSVPVRQKISLGEIDFIDRNNKKIDTYIIGDSLIYIIVTDIDKNNQPRMRDTVVVTLWSTIGQDTEIVVLTEVYDTAGVFSDT